MSPTTKRCNQDVFDHETSITDQLYGNGSVHPWDILVNTNKLLGFCWDAPPMVELLCIHTVPIWEHPFLHLEEN
jgi:hypothetical protein